MKKVISTFILFLCAIVFVACTATENTSPVVISKLITATRQANNVIELYNPSDAEVSLEGHSLQFYSNGGTEVTRQIDLTGKIGAKSYYTITGNSISNETVKALADFVYTEGSLPFNGDDAIMLNVSGKDSDLIGNLGLDIFYSKDVTLIRTGLLEDYKPSSSYKETKFIAYTTEMYKYLENDTHEIKTLEQIYQGPKLETRYITDYTYVNESNPSIGGGGAVKTTVTSIADGDTASFSAAGNFPGGRLRYFYLNTPEVNGTYTEAQPWGYVASKYNKDYLLKNPSQKEIYVQSVPNEALSEMNGRLLGFVWINGYLSQFLIVSEGLTIDVPTQYTNGDLLLTYKDVPYLTFLKFAEARAKEGGWGTKGYPANPNGQKSPDWDYNLNKLKTTSPNWEPLLDLPF